MKRMNEQNEQQKYLKRIEEINHIPTFVYLDIDDKKTKKHHPGKKFNIGMYQLVDHRTVGCNEIVFDFDYGFNMSKELAKKVVGVLDNRGWSYNIFVTGGQGIHISCWFNKLEFSTDNSLCDLFKKARQLRLSYKHIRKWLWNLILEEASININKAVKIDTAPLNFNEGQGKYHPIRLCGGRNHKRNDVLNSDIITYKSCITTEQLTNAKKRIEINNIDSVVYPTEINAFNINISEFSAFLIKYIQQQEKVLDIKEEIKFKGSYVELQSVQTILEGLSKGQRAKGAQILAIACILDGFNKQKAYLLAEKYVNNCNQIGEEFVIEEANRWIDWIYDQKYHFWNCQLVRDLNVHDELMCNFCEQNKGKIIKVLEDKSLLKRIDSFLSMTVVGEEKTRILVFLLMLSKKFTNMGFGAVKPASIIFSSMSSSGKSWMTKRLLPLFGQENRDYFVFSRMTKSSLNYFCEIDMNNKLMFIEELQGLDESSNQLRLWISEGTLNLSTVEKIKDSEGTTTNELIFKKTVGQPVFITGTAEDKIDEQMNNRSWLISLDVSEEQNKAILEFEDRIAHGKCLVDEKELRILQDCIKELKNYNYIIPFYNYKDLNIPTKNVRIRRDYNKFRFLISCSALLHQRQRITFTDETTGKRYLICSFDDYEIAKEYGEEVLKTTFSGLQAQQIDLANQIKNNSTWNTDFTSSNIQETMGWSQKKCWTALTQLEECGLILLKSGGGHGNIKTYSYNFKKKLVDLKLPSKEDLMKKWQENNCQLVRELQRFSISLLLRNESFSIGNKNKKPDNSRPYLLLQKYTKEDKFYVSKARNSTLKRLFIDSMADGVGSSTSTLKCSLEHTKTSGSREPIVQNKLIPEISNSIQKTVIRLLQEQPKTPKTIEEIQKKTSVDEEQLEKEIQVMMKEGIIFQPKPDKIMLL